MLGLEQARETDEETPPSGLCPDPRCPLSHCSPPLSAIYANHAALTPTLQRCFSSDLVEILCGTNQGARTRRFVLTAKTGGKDESSATVDYAGVAESAVD